jgi:hypothetical protein
MIRSCGILACNVALFFHTVTKVIKHSHKYIQYIFLQIIYDIYKYIQTYIPNMISGDHNITVGIFYTVY